MCMDIAKFLKMRPNTKHIGITHYHFRSKVIDGTIKVVHIDASEQQSDMFTKVLDHEWFRYLRKVFIG